MITFTQAIPERDQFKSGSYRKIFLEHDTRISATDLWEMTLGKSGSNRQKIPHSIESMEKIQMDDDVDFAASEAGQLRIL